MAALSALPAVGQPPARMPVQPRLPTDPDKLMKAAREFEAMALGELLQPMFDTVDMSKGPFGGGAGEESWKPMMVTEMAKQIEAHGGLGLAKPVYEAMLRMQEARTAEGSVR